MAEGQMAVEKTCSGDYCDFDELSYMQSPQPPAIRRMPMPSMDADMQSVQDMWLPELEVDNPIYPHTSGKTPTQGSDMWLPELEVDNPIYPHASGKMHRS